MNSLVPQANKRSTVGWPGPQTDGDALAGERTWTARNARLIVFLVAVAVPTICAGLYFRFVMPPEYQAEARFAVRGTSEGLPGSDRIGGSLGQLIALNDTQEAHIVAAYINSLAIVQKIGQGGDLAALFGAKAVEADRRLSPETAPERAIAFWRRHVEADVEMISGVTTLRVRAFAPGEAISLSRSILAASETMANSLSARVKASSIAASEAEVDKAVVAMEDSERAEARFRAERGLLDPSETAASTLRMLEQLQADRRRMETQLSVSTDTAGSNSPAVENLTRQIAALDRETDQVRALLTSGGDGASVSSAIQSFGRLEFDREFAEQRLLAARAEAARAKAQAARRRVYLEAYDPPALAPAPAPARWRNLIQVAAGSGVMAGVALLAFAGLRDFESS